MKTESKRLILIMPPQQGLLEGFAAGLISLANYVASMTNKIATDILDLSCFSSSGAKTELDHTFSEIKERTIFVGITTTTASYQSALEVGRFVKGIAPNAIIVFGGHHASADPEITLRYHKQTVDFIIAGEGEKALFELIHLYPILTNVPGICFLDSSENFVRNDLPAALSSEELDSIPINYKDNGLIGTPGKFDHATYVSARGCPLNCSFCAVGNDDIRFKSISAVKRDIEFLLDMGFSRIAIEDNFFAHSPSRTHDICKALANIRRKRNGAFAWDCQTRVESLARKNTIDLMAKAGCEAVYIGVESLHPEHLLYLNKTTDPSEYLNMLTQIVIPSLLDTEIECYLNLQFGLPGETEEHERATHSRLEALGRLADSRGKTITIFPQLHVVYPGTAHFQQGVNKRRFTRDIFETFTEWEYRQPPVLYWLGEHFAHGTGGIPEGILKPAVLRSGGFYDTEEVVDTKAVFRISAVLRAIDRIKGMRTFNYGDYIVSEARPQNISSAQKHVAVNLDAKGVIR